MSNGDRLDRVLAYLAVSGGAALLCKRTNRIVAARGQIDPVAAREALRHVVEPPEAIVHVSTGIIAEVGLNHRLFVHVPSSLSPEFGVRMRRARDIVERFALPTTESNGGQAPPSSAPAHAVVFARRVPCK